MPDPTQDEAIVRAVPWVVAAFGGAGGVVAAVRGALGLVHAFRELRREVADLKADVAKLMAIVNGNPEREEDWGFAETKRQVRAMKKRVDQFHEIVAGEHGLYSKFARYDERLMEWATWRHDVMDKEMSRIAGEVGAHDDDLEDLRKEVALCERRK